jgi:hypothetical protein
VSPTVAIYQRGRPSLYANVWCDYQARHRPRLYQIFARQGVGELSRPKNRVIRRCYDWEVPFAPPEATTVFRDPVS